MIQHNTSAMTDPTLAFGESLVQKGLLEPGDLEAMERNAQANGHSGLTQYLLQEKQFSEEFVTKLWAEELGLAWQSRLADADVDPQLLVDLPIHYLKKHLLLPLASQGEALRVAVFDPFDQAGLDHLQFLLGREILEPVLMPGQEILAAINRAFGEMDSAADSIIEDIHQNEEHIWSDLEESLVSEDLLDESSEAPIIKLVNHILSQAVRFKASDIHVEPYQSDLKIRFRMDGVLYNIHSLPKKLHAAVVSRIKILARLNIAEKRVPQDGRINVRIGNRSIDLRVSSLPTAFGERIVLRLLEKDIRVLNLEEVGLDAANLQVLKRLIRISHGIILVTGPTGSGKTPTLYAALNEINTPDKNILTIEDPIEYQLDGIGQMQVNPKIGVTFAKGLRSMVRQDPDVILVGEIRDLETAEIAIQAALTGHLVFSTLHTNDAAGAITRLIDMGIEPFLVSSSVQAILAQRLVRTLCTKCRQAFVPDPSQLQELGLENPPRDLELYKACGCDGCLNTGYKGRTGIFEFLKVRESIQSLLLRTAEANQIRQLAIQEGMQTLRRNGVEKIRRGRTTIDEVFRVTQL